MKRLAVGLLVTCMILTMAGQALAGIAFVDTEDDANQAAIIKLASVDIIRGSASDSGGIAARPGDNITRTEFAILMVRCLGLEREALTIADKPEFSDVGDSYRWAWGYITLAARLGIIKGSEGRFRPGDKVYNDEVLTMLVRALGREFEVDPKEAWPRGHIAVAQELGIDFPSNAGSEPATRGQAAACLAAALNIPLIRHDDQLQITATGDSFLSRQGFTGVVANVLAVSPSGASQAWVELPDDSLLPADIDQVNDRVELSAEPTLYGINGLGDLIGQTADIVMDANHTLVYAAPVITISGVIGRVELPQVILSDGTSVIIDGEPLLRVNGDAGIRYMPFARLVLAPGNKIRFTVDPGNRSHITCIDTYFDMEGVLRLEADCYRFSSSFPSLPARMWGGEPAGPLRRSTVIYVNGVRADEATLRRELSNPDLLCLASIHVDSDPDGVSMLSAGVYDGDATVYQPLLSQTGTSFKVPCQGDTPATTRSYALAPGALVQSDGEPASLNELRRGDLLSFRTDADGKVCYLSALEDEGLPEIAWYAEQKSTLDQYQIKVNEALEPTTVSIIVDGRAFTLSPASDRPGDGDSFSVRYDENTDYSRGRTTITLWPQQSLGEGGHVIAVIASDYAGNRFQQLLGVECDATPARATSTSVVDNRRLEITFDDDMDEDAVRDLSNWYVLGHDGCSPASVYYNSDMRTAWVTFMDPLPGATIVSRNLVDAAGNAVEITVTIPK